MSADSRDIAIGAYDELKERERIVLDIDGVSIGVYFIAGEIRAWHNVCPHLGGPVCQGKIVPRTLQGVDEATRKSRGLQLSQDEKMLVCPWHGFEFDILNGRHAIDDRHRLKAVPVRVEAGQVVVTL
ncbi:Rieske (2Fe-2S) protein [Sinisalibacter aestuarii]|uniref:Ferredoxin n=1 Tax=Sinisalibacter aestuarii TaxID=2949426 RepID=A0ABQ5M022_9RHOB|nr:Rieske 2Fe-2S domain-containing protein [Sinisalibacter aestuarii]GKY89951.1 ferredoxin [Sinisalibacter aestuarii]